MKTTLDYPRDVVTSFEKVLSKVLSELSDREFKAIFFRYWQSYSIVEIAAQLNISWDAANELIEISLIKLRSNIDVEQARNLLHYYETTRRTRA